MTQPHQNPMEQQQYGAGSQQFSGGQQDRQFSQQGRGRTQRHGRGQFGGGQQSRFGGGQQGQYGTQGQMGGQQDQMGGQQGQQGQMGGSFEDYLTGDERLVLHDVAKAARTAAWCADRCLDEGPQMATCIRLCEDVAELGAVTQKLIARESAFVPQVIEPLIQAADECSMECGQHPNEHCQETASVLHQLVQTSVQLLDTQFGGGRQGQQGQVGGQSQSQFGGSQSMGGQPQSGRQQSQIGGQGGMGTEVPIQQSNF